MRFRKHCPHLQVVLSNEDFSHKCGIVCKPAHAAEKRPHNRKTQHVACSQKCTCQSRPDSLNLPREQANTFHLMRLLHKCHPHLQSPATPTTTLPQPTLVPRVLRTKRLSARRLGFQATTCTPRREKRARTNRRPTKLQVGRLLTSSCN